MGVLGKSEGGDKTFVAIKGKTEESPYLSVSGEKIDSTFLQGVLTSFNIKAFDGANGAFRQIQLGLKKDDEDVVMSIVLESMMGRTLANCLCGFKDFDRELYISPYQNKNGTNTVFVKVVGDEKGLSWTFDKDFIQKTFLVGKKYDLEKMDNFLEAELRKTFDSLIREKSIDNIVNGVFDEEGPEVSKKEAPKVINNDKDDLPF